MGASAWTTAQLLHILCAGVCGPHRFGSLSQPGVVESISAGPGRTGWNRANRLGSSVFEWQHVCLPLSQGEGDSALRLMGCLVT